MNKKVIALLLCAAHSLMGIGTNNIPKTLGDAVEQYIPNDPLFPLQWGLKNIDSGFDIGVTNAWKFARGNKKIAIVVIDSGIDYTHPDLIKNIWKNPYEIPGNKIDDDKNGYIDDVHGINAITGSGDPMDDHGHGTFIAGVIGAEANNDIGIAGIMHDVSLISCKFLDAKGVGRLENAARCLDYVADLASRNIGVTIVATNNSYCSALPNEVFKKAIERQRDLGILFVTSAGSLALSLDENPIYPASFGVDNIIVVAEADKKGNLSSFSNYGTNTVHLAGPGEGILSTTLNGGYQVWSGSASAAFVTGIIGLINSNSRTSWAQTKHLLMRNVAPLAKRTDSEKLISGGFASLIWR